MARKRLLTLMLSAIFSVMLCWLGFSSWTGKEICRCAALLAQYIAFYMISSRLGKEAEIENFLTNKFVMIFWVIYLTNKFIRSSKTKK